MNIEKNPAFLKTFIQEELYLIERMPAVAKETDIEAAHATEVKKDETVTVVEVEDPKDLVILLKNDFPELEPTQKDLLQKILFAVKVDLSSTPLLSEKGYKNSPEVLGGYRRVLSFGVELPQVSSRYQLLKKGDQQFLVSDSLAALEQAIALKGKLWSAMQLMFGA